MKTTTPVSPVRLALGALAVLVAGCVGVLAPQGDAPPRAPASGTVQAPAPLPPILPHNEALLAAANDLFARATPPGEGERVPLVIDPLVDGMAGEQSAATQAMNERIADLVRTRYRRFEVLRFDAAALKRSPVVLVGTFTPVGSDGRTAGERVAYRICLALADLRSGRILSKGVARSRVDGFDGTPLPVFRDSPGWMPDERVDGYIRTCQGTKAGDPIHPAYLDGILAASLVSQATDAYNAGRYREALERYEAARATPAGRQARVLNGVYLAHWKLGQREEATRAFGDIVDFGLEHQRLAVKFLFRPGSTGFITDQRLSAPYPMWIGQIARRAEARGACLEVAGHASPTGPEPLNERLSLLRAEMVRGQLVSANPGLVKRTIASGIGSRETMVGTGRDDASDAIDRRVEFRVMNCRG